MKKIVILDYGVGNLYSIKKAILYTSNKVDVEITNNIKKIKNCNRIILPGQGNIKKCISLLENKDLYKEIIYIIKKKPVLGICIGMQILFKWSEEGPNKGLNILKGKNIRFSYNIKKVPQIGWNKIFKINNHFILKNINNFSFFYFVHSYYIKSKLFKNINAITKYKKNNFISIISKDNIFATQFHPEKSSLQGLKIFENFINWNP
ncbi:imidazole glycerol phosphate synthase, glutamine amidotransferase subunit [Candidatus Zinderia insecticola CARI]|uniref:Imidazole glycerol phosphate synthase subunit HisH n=1 Tax=Zinderia insecticola (strain CARI) TaxID=871271 RepID=E0TJ10_ZINIC|nr:imidazole glycerol phosphate synthase, glutamine amidotransferase subunit [Candidatus Zinderia insecticola CARI]